MWDLAGRGNIDDLSLAEALRCAGPLDEHSQPVVVEGDVERELWVALVAAAIEDGCSAEDLLRAMADGLLR